MKIKIIPLLLIVVIAMSGCSLAVTKSSQPNPASSMPNQTAAPSQSPTTDVTQTPSQSTETSASYSPSQEVSPSPSVNPSPEVSPSPSPSETEKTQIEIISENAFDYLNFQSPHTDEEICSELMVLSPEKTSDLGLIHFREVQGRFLGYLETKDGDNVLMFVGEKDNLKKRFVTAWRIPVYAIESNVIRNFRIDKLNQLNYELGSTKYLVSNNRLDILKSLDKLVGGNVVDRVIVEDWTSDKDMKKINKTGNKYILRVAEDLRHSVGYIRSLTYGVFNNGIKDLGYPNPKLLLWKIEKEDSRDKIYQAISDLVSGDVGDIPITVNILFQSFKNG